MWDFRTGANTVLTKSQAKALGIKVDDYSIGVRLRVEQITDPHIKVYPWGVMFFDEWDYIKSCDFEKMWETYRPTTSELIHGKPNVEPSGARARFFKHTARRPEGKL